MRTEAFEIGRPVFVVSTIPQERNWLTWKWSRANKFSRLAQVLYRDGIFSRCIHNIHGHAQGLGLDLPSVDWKQRGSSNDLKECLSMKEVSEQNYETYRNQQYPFLHSSKLVGPGEGNQCHRTSWTYSLRARPQLMWPLLIYSNWIACLRFFKWVTLKLIRMLTYVVQYSGPWAQQGILGRFQKCWPWREMRKRKLQLSWYMLAHPIFSASSSNIVGLGWKGEPS